MKLFILAITTLTSASAIACPNLAAKFKDCSSKQGYLVMKNLEVTMSKDEKGINTFDFSYIDQDEVQTNDVYIADGKVRTEKSNYEGLDVIEDTTVTCDKDVLNVVSAVSAAEGSLAFKVEMKVQMVEEKLQALITFDGEDFEEVVCTQ